MLVSPFALLRKRPTVCVTGAGVGVDSAWEQIKLKARKMLGADWASERQANIAQPKRVSAGQSPASSARFVRRVLEDFLELQLYCFLLQALDHFPGISMKLRPFVAISSSCILRICGRSMVAIIP